MNFEEVRNEIQTALRELREGVHNSFSKAEAQERDERLNARIDELQSKMEKPISSPAPADKGEDVKAFKSWMRTGDDAVLKTMSSTNADGGYSIPEEWDRSLLNLMRDQNVMRQLCNVFSVGSEDYKKLVNIHGSTVGWVGETSTRSNTNTAQFAALTPVFGEVYALAHATQKILDDSIFDLGSWLVGEIGDDAAAAEESAFIQGNGVNRPKGFLAYNVVSTADATRSFGDIQYVPSGAAGAWATNKPADAIIDLIYSMKSGYRNGAAFVGPKAVYQGVRKFVDANNAYIWQPSLQAGEPASLLGYPTHESESMPAVANNSYSLAFANWKRAYYIADRIGTRVLRDPYTAKPYVIFYVTKRVGGFLADSNAVKVMKFAAT
jgi:HK97 family phage major capsid protein